MNNIFAEGVLGTIAGVAGVIGANRKQAREDEQAKTLEKMKADSAMRLEVSRHALERDSYNTYDTTDAQGNVSAVTTRDHFKPSKDGMSGGYETDQYDPKTKTWTPQESNYQSAGLPPPGRAAQPTAPSAASTGAPTPALNEQNAPLGWLATPPAAPSGWSAAPANSGWSAAPANPESGSGWSAKPENTDSGSGWSAKPAKPANPDAESGWNAAPAKPANSGWSAKPANPDSGSGWSAKPNAPGSAANPIRYRPGMPKPPSGTYVIHPDGTLAVVP
jgi:hypothetical protein